MINSLEIEGNKELCFKNVISFRKKLRQSEINEALAGLMEYIKNNGSAKNGPVISSIHNMEISGNDKIIDIELLIPVEGNIRSNNEYILKPIFHLKHALYTRFIGNPSQLQTAYDALNEYIIKNKFQPITSFYSINVNEEGIISGEIPIIDIYFGVNPSIL